MKLIISPKELIKEPLAEGKTANTKNCATAARTSPKPSRGSAKETKAGNNIRWVKSERREKWQG